MTITTTDSDGRIFNLITHTETDGRLTLCVTIGTAKALNAGRKPLTSLVHLTAEQSADLSAVAAAAASRATSANLGRTLDAISKAGEQ